MVRCSHCGKRVKSIKILVTSTGDMIDLCPSCLAEFRELRKQLEKIYASGVEVKIMRGRVCIDNNNDELAKAVKEYRKRNGLTQEQFAEIAGVCRHTVMHVENQSARLTPAVKALILNVIE